MKLRDKNNLFTILISILGLLIGFPFNAIAQNSPSIIQKSPNDDRHYLSATLDNGLKVVVVSDPDAHTCGAALVVNVGLFDDPKEFPGLAHFLEHMLFLGTQKFPVPDEFQNYLQAYGGHRNATTQGEKTSYFFNIQPHAFRSALERFSDFFIAPLFTQELTDRELNAVDAEFHLNAHQDNWGSHEINKETSNPAHPFYRYFGGNLQTLGYDKVKLHQALIDFHQKQYQANKMTLALVGPQDAKILMQWAKDYFYAIPGKGTSPHRSSPKLFEKKNLGLDIHMKSTGDRRELKITFPIDSRVTPRSKKAGALLSAIIGYEGQGGLATTLKNKQWISGLSAYYDDLTQEQDAMEIHCSLTELGLKHVDEITQTLFSYVTLIKNNGLDPQFFNEIKAINHWDFLYLNKQEPMSFAKMLADALHDFPPAELLTHFFFMPNEEIPQKEIQTVLLNLKPENMRRFIMSKDEKGNRQSKWYGTSYSVNKISKQKMKWFARALSTESLSLPKPNPYIPTKLSLVKGTQTSAKAPQKIALPGITLWHHQDLHFKKPQADIEINFVSKLAKSTPMNNALSDLYVTLAIDMLSDHFYPAAFAGMSISMHQHPRGITLSVSGYSEKQDLLIQQIIQALKEFNIDPLKFNTIKDRYERGLKNTHQHSLHQQALNDLSILLYHPSWHPDELLQAAQSTQLDDINTFMSTFWNTCEIEMLVHGNYSKAQAIDLSKIVTNQFSHKKTSLEIQSVTQVVKLEPQARHFLPIATTDSNHIAVWYLQNPSVDFATLAKTEILGNILHVPYFQSLRVDKQLAYALGANAYTLDKVSGLVFWIQSTKATPTELLLEIQTFLKNYQKQMSLLTDNELNNHRQALIHQLRRPALTRVEQTHQWWSSIEQGLYEFDYAENLAQAIEQVNKKDLLAFYQQLCDPNSKLGSLLVLSESQVQLPKSKEIASLDTFKKEVSYFPALNGT